MSMTLLLLGLGLVGTLALAFIALSGQSASKATKRRLELIKERHAEGTLAASANAQIRKLFANRNSKVEGWFSTLVPKPALMRLRLDKTGRNITLGRYAMTSVGLALAIVAGMTSQGAPFTLALLFSLFVGIGLPHLVVGRMISGRLKAFNANFPDAIELMVRGLRSGLPITETLGVVASEIGGPVGIEFRSVSDKMKIGRTMEAALQDVADRLGTPEFQFFVITLAIQRETGGNLAETLSNLADVLRKRAQMKLKIKAMSSEAKASAMIVGALPFIVFTLVYMLNPNYMGGFFSEERLIVAGLGALVWMGIGVAIMAKMVNFEI
ncbi:type II secretion system F family protein [Sphingomonas sp. LHG3406-1]|uniref:type II secretion system F family protein n=1 Tax=Sphingomonas sp. LHG3406-1 TaxID=2804617 RepID=UPI00262F5A9E|nr:type II secretion system F family protein [Sphingomonas sp. LHG3406-1]